MTEGDDLYIKSEHEAALAAVGRRKLSRLKTTAETSLGRQVIETFFDWLGARNGEQAEVEREMGNLAAALAREDQVLQDEALQVFALFLDDIAAALSSDAGHAAVLRALQFVYRIGLLITVRRQ